MPSAPFAASAAGRCSNRPTCKATAATITTSTGAHYTAPASRLKLRAGRTQRQPPRQNPVVVERTIAWLNLALVDAKPFFDAMAVEIQQRSPEQIARMERAMGLASEERS